jgi:cytochrome P450
MVQALLLGGASLALFLYWSLRSLRKHLSTLPPGPPDHFLLGNIKHMAVDDALNLMSKACWQYGDKGYMTFRYPFQQPALVLYKPDAVVEVFEKLADKVNSRDMLTISLDEFTGSGKDILMGNGEYWKAARKIFVQGVMSSVNKAAPIIEKHLKKAIEQIKGKEMAVQNIRDVLFFQTFSVIADMSVGRVPMSDELVREFVGLSDRLNVFLDPMNVRNTIPVLKHLPYQDEFRKLLARRNEILQKVIDQHRKTVDKENPQDFLDSIIIDAENNKEFPLDLLYVLLDTFLGGTDTSSHTIEFMIGYLVNYPDVQKKVHEELDANVKGRFPTLEDEKNLPYLSAVLREVMRLAPVGGMLMRLATEDIQVHGYNIPKGTRILAMPHAMQRDPELWVNPEEFRPERFLEEEKDVAMRGPEMPKVRDHLKSTFFGIGKRGCAGFQLAKKELFLQAAYYLWAFEFSAPNQSEKLDLTMFLGLVSKPKFPVCVRAKYRQS